jgi:uncharacterized protein involved in exopolysaccharide biosynthesis
VKEKDEIDLQSLIKSIWSKKFLILKVTIGFTIFGLVLALTSPEEYLTTTKLIPEEAESGLISGSLGGLASLAGVDLSSFSGGGAAINPILYESVAKSTPFLIELMKEEFYLEGLGKKITLFEYLMEHQKVGLFGTVASIPGSIIKLIMSDDEEEERSLNNDGIIRISKDEEAIAEILIDRMQVYVDWELNVVVINVEMQDPRVAAEVNKFTMEYITNFVTKYSMAKIQEQQNFVVDQHKVKKAEFEKAQMNLALFRDRNKNVSTSQAKSEEELLKSQYDIAFNMYSQLAQQQETINLQLNEKIPVFTVLEPPRIATDNYKPNKILILISSIMAGIFLSLTYVIVFDKVKSLIQKD